MTETRMQKVREWLQARHVGQAFQPAIHWQDLRSFAKEDLSAVSLSRRKLPHWELESCTYFVTFRAREFLGRVLENEALAGIVEEAFWFGHEERYILNAYVVMPNHAHLLMKPLAGWSLSRILQGIKGYTAREINKGLSRRGAFWQDECFDHLVRNEADWVDKFDYIHNNPVGAGLAERPENYPFSSLVTMHSKGRLESLPR
jgi:REP element-mobilizing transposase RayT